MKVLVLDTVHGGKIVAEFFLKRGDDVTAVDVYGVTPKDVVGGLEKRGAKVRTSAPQEEFDLCVMPCHCPDAFIQEAKCKRIIWTSKFVNENFDPYDKRFRIEITGVREKESTCFVLAHLLDQAGKRVYLHTLFGSGPYANGKHVITDIASISPATLMQLPKTEYDILVCEVSLGGSGKANISAISDLSEDYGIARNTRKAHEGKKDVLNDNLNIVREEDFEIWKSYGKPLKAQEKRIEQLNKNNVKINYIGSSEITLKEKQMQCFDQINIALEICSAMNIPKDAVLKGLSSFAGIPLNK